jgi:uncharacterized lipoprotein YajG
MRKLVVILALFPVIGACATQQTARQAAKPAVATKQVCTMVEVETTGSLMDKRQVCEQVPVETPVAEPTS